MTPTVVTVGPLATPHANNIVTTVTPVAGTALTLTTSPFVMDTPRRVLVTYGSGQDSGHRLLLTGTTASGTTQSETITIPATSTTINSILDYATVTSILPIDSFTNGITVGTSQVASSEWVRVDGWADPSLSIQCVVVGTVNYTVQQTLDDPDSPSNPVALGSMTWTSSNTAALVGATSTQIATQILIPVFIRVTLNTETAATSSVTMTTLQSGSVTY